MSSGSRTAADRLRVGWWADGLSRAERAAPPAAEPEWARLTEAALAMARSTGPAEPDGATGVEAFAAPLRPWAEVAADRALAGVAADDLDRPALRAAFAAGLGRRLAGLAARTLVAELNAARAAGSLTGATPADRFADFLRGTGGPDGLTALVEAYPGLARLLGQTCAQAADGRRELLHRLAADRPAIVAGLLGGADPGPLVRVAAAGDAHGGGRTVALLTFAGGARVVYKPRPLGAHVRFGALVRWLDERAGRPGLRTAGVLDRDGYGWTEFVTAGPCATVEDLDRFYRRLGLLLALLYAVDATDMHFENLLACGDQPVLVDLETLFHPDLFTPASTGADPATAALTASVLRTAVLPQLWLGEHGALDVSGLGGDDGEAFPYDVVGWSGAGTDEMRLVRRPVAFTGADNRPRLGDRPAEPGEWTASLLAGFRTGYDAVVQGRAELLAPDGPLAAVAADPVRVLVRQSERYGRLLDESTHPDLLRPGGDRDRVFDRLVAESAGDPLRQRLVPYERADLWAGDVPLFSSRPGRRDLVTAGGTVLADLLPVSGLDTVRAKVAGLGPVDRADQEWCLAAALAVREPATGHAGEPAAGATPAVAAAEPDPERLLAAACGIADELVSRAVRDAGRANWPGLELVEDRHWMVLPMGAGLGAGYPGVALFLADLAGLTGVERYRELARLAVTPLPLLVADLAAAPERAAVVGSGGFAGLGGIAYAVARLAPQLPGAGLDAVLPAVVTLTGQVPDAEDGVAAGRAGGLAALLAVGDDSALAAADTLADRLAASAGDDRPAGDGPGRFGRPGGFAHGGAGAGWALSRYAEARGRHAAAGRRLLDAAAPPSGPGWCRGLAGQVLADPAGPGADARGAELSATGPLPDMSLCHGELGVLEALSALAARGHEAAAAARRRRAALLLDRLDRQGPRCGTPRAVPTPGLLHGLAGLGHGLLRLGFPDRVAATLLLA